MKVLFAVDGSAGSLDALSQVAPLLAPGKDEIAVYCSPPDANRVLDAPLREVLSQATDEVVDLVFKAAQKRLPEGWGSPHRIVDDQDARGGIVAAADSWHADLIVVGARGLSTLERLLLGSVSRAVVHASKVPVWVARPSKIAWAKGVNVLVACDTPEHGRRSAEVLAAFSWPPGSKARTVTAVPSMLAGKVPDWVQKQARSPEVEEMVRCWAQEHDTELRHTRTAMQQCAATMPAGLAHLEPIVAEGEPSGVILSAIAREKSDLVTVGAVHKNWLASTLLGSTSEAVINHAACSVLVIPQQAEAR